MVLLAVTQIVKQAQKGFKPLFDGKTTTGWHTYGQNNRWQRLESSGWCFTSGLILKALKMVVAI